MDESTVKEYLVENDEQFRKLVETHQQYEQQLQKLLESPFLNNDDQLQEAIIKKKKLAVKDQMQMIIHRFQTQQSGQA